jgi:bifunctional DNA-binding transcriptional regulator/antitoxin component of YhaV-PrlF toxin-antitoxin module
LLDISYVLAYITAMNFIQTCVSSKGQMVLPAKLRARYNITQGTRITLLCDDTGFYVRKTADPASSDLDQVIGVLARLAAKRPPRPASALSDHERIGQMLLADDQRIKQAASSAAPAPVRKHIKALNL